MRSIAFLFIVFAACFLIACGEKGTGSSISKTGKPGEYEIRSGPVRMVVDARRGARVTELHFADVQLLTGEDVHDVYYGSTFWFSPQSGYWPQPGTIENQPYRAEMQDDRIIFTSDTDPGTGLWVTKEIRPGPGEQSVSLKYRITNDSDSIRKVAGWEVSRFPKEGIVFFPLGEVPVDSFIDDKVPSLARDGIYWLEFSPGLQLDRDESPKLFADGSEGWIGYAYRDLLLVKTFPDLDPDSAATGETDAEVYMSPGFQYIEIEVQGPCEQLEKGESTGLEVCWNLMELQEDIAREMGNGQLVDLARTVKDR